MEYLDGELSEEQRSSFESHLGVCPDCVAFMESYKQTMQLTKLLQISAAGEITEDKILEDVPHDLIDAILAARPK